jgi:two-component system sensor histidine kinase KdpD
VAGWVAAVLLPLVLAWALHGFRDTDQLPLASLLLLAAAVLVALVGGLLPALLAALVSFVTLNYWFTPPVGRFTVAEPANLAGLLVFLAVASAVATVVDRASRRTSDALRARTEAATMGSLSRSVLTGQDTAEAIVEKLREMFGQRAVSLLESTDAGWTVLASTGPSCAALPEQGDTRVRVDESHVLALCGEPLRASDQRVLEAFAVQTSLVLEYRRLRDRDDRAAALESADATSTALLRAVSHDLRTPLATMRAGVDGLRGDRLGSADRAELLAAVDTSTEQLEGLIDNLLDLSRLQTGLVSAHLVARSLEEVLPLAVAGPPPGAVHLDLVESTPLVLTDAGLLERVVANVVGNAVRVSAGTPVRVLAHVLPETVEVMVVDQGPGVEPAQRERMFEPFQRLSDAAPGGLGLGLAVAQGLSRAIGGRLSAEDTPGGGLTMVLSLPRADTGVETP